jgi:RpiB/LacA/LacB family sugar-phosphate isomerase
MRIVLGSDHAGFEMKQQILDYVRGLGHEVLDVEAMAVAIRNNQAERGILICGSGVGASVAANKIPGIRAAVCHDCYSAHQGVEHDDMNILVLGSRVIAVNLARDLVRRFLDARFSGEERHLRRLGKVKQLETRYR